VRYNFGPDFLRLKTIGLKIDFEVLSEEPIKNLTMIERHFLGDKLIREYEFNFGFLIPKSKNSTEFIYDLPQFNDEEQKLILSRPWIVQSDTYFFVEGQLIIHNKAAYNYS
jgi:hypothetical protein